MTTPPLPPRAGDLIVRTVFYQQKVLLAEATRSKAAGTAGQTLQSAQAQAMTVVQSG